MQREFIPFSRNELRPEFIRKMPSGWVLSDTRKRPLPPSGSELIWTVVIVALWLALVATLPEDRVPDMAQSVTANHISME